MIIAKNAKKTLALTTALAALVPMTAFAAPHHDRGNWNGGSYSNNDTNYNYNDRNTQNDRDNDNRNNDNRDTNRNGYTYNNNGYNYSNRNTNGYNYNNNSYGYNNNYGYNDPQANRQQNKNTWRNLGVAGAAVAALGLLNHNGTAALLGAAGAAYSANRYEKDRQSQSQQQNDYGNWQRNRRRF